MLALVTLLGFGLLYSLAGTGLGRMLFPHQATGSLIEREGRVVGSSLVAQSFADDRYFQSRPSAAKYDVIDVDGVRVQFGDGWGLLRASNTQPVLVLRFEARSQAGLDRIRREFSDWLAGQGVAL